MDEDGIHPQAARIVRRQNQLQRVLPDRSLRGFRLVMRLASWIRNRDPPPVAQVFDRSVPGPDEPIPIRVYRPEGPGPFPTVVYFHGGGFVAGGLESHDALCRHLTRESGCVVVAVAYRLAPEHPFPAAVEDAIAATEWAAEHPEILGSDGSLAVVGDSAGGNLAGVVALDAMEQGGPDIDYQVLIYPSIGTEMDQPSVRENAGVILDRETLAWFGECYYGSEIHRQNPYADPAKACDLSGLPPATVLTAEFDPLRDGGVAYAEQLADAGVAVRHVHYDDMIHGFLTMTEQIDRATDAIGEVAGDLRDGLGRA